MGLKSALIDSLGGGATLRDVPEPGSGTVLERLRALPPPPALLLLLPRATKG